jgi:hypothetical protein
MVFLSLDGEGGHEERIPQKRIACSEVLSERLGTRCKVCQPQQKYHGLLIAYLHKVMHAHVSQNHYFFLLTIARIAIAID